MTLNNEEKISLINQHKKNNEFNKYNLQLSLVEENAATAPNAETITSTKNGIAARIAALLAEKDTLTE